MRNKKDFLPNTIEDLEEICYGKTGNGKDLNFVRLKKYDDHIRSGIISLIREQEVKELFSPIGKLEKIKEKGGKLT